MKRLAAWGLVVADIRSALDASIFGRKPRRRRGPTHAVIHTNFFGDTAVTLASSFDEACALTDDHASMWSNYQIVPIKELP